MGEEGRGKQGRKEVRNSVGKGRRKGERRVVRGGRREKKRGGMRARGMEMCEGR